MFQYQVESYSKFLAIILSWDRSTSEFLTWHDKFLSCHVKTSDVDLSWFCRELNLFGRAQVCALLKRVLACALATCGIFLLFIYFLVIYLSR